MSDVLPAIRLAADLGMVVLIWLVQLVIYPSFHYTEKDHFKPWHHRYTRNISMIVIPLMFMQAICIGLVCLQTLSLGNLVSASAVLVAWCVTFGLSVPCHHQLQAQGNQPELVDRLIRSNWLRTISWTIALIAGCFA